MATSRPIACVKRAEFLFSLGDGVPCAEITRLPTNALAAHAVPILLLPERIRL